MRAISRTRTLAVIAAVAAMVMAGALISPSPSDGTAGAQVASAVAVTAEEAIELIEGENGVLSFEVAENATNFAWAGNPELVDGLPAARTAYLTQGYIYPEGTLTNGNGVLEDGSPEFPDKVLGQWSCWGWYAGSEAPAGLPRWLTTHLFNFGGEWGTATLVSEGYSIDDMEVALERAIVGGTGPYDGARGVQMETNLGFNATNGVNVSYEVRLSEG
jgi:hypothetical protein